MPKLVCLFIVLALSGCAAMKPDMPPLVPVSQVDLARYMGNWHVIANIPPWIEKGAHNSIENYRMDEDGNIPTVFTYRKDSFEGKLKTLESKAFVRNRESNAEWGVQFIWPIKAQYLITYVAADYSQAIVARDKRDYVWMLARTPAISDRDYAQLRARIADMGYDVSKLQKVPQRNP